MEFDVLHLNGLASICCSDELLQLTCRLIDSRLTPSCAFKHRLVVQPQPQLWHTRKVALHLHCTQNLTPNDVTRRIDLERRVSCSIQGSQESTDKEIDAFDNIQKDLILPIPDAFGSPRNGVGNSDGWSDDFQFMRFLSDVSAR